MATKPLDPQHAAAMEGFVSDTLKLAGHLAPGYGLDPIDAAMALGAAGSVLLYKAFGGDPEKCRAAAKIYSSSAISSMEDMIAGRESPSYSKN